MQTLQLVSMLTAASAAFIGLIYLEVRLLNNAKKY